MYSKSWNFGFCFRFCISANAADSKTVNSISFIFICIAKVVKEIKVCVGFDNFEMGFETRDQ